MEFYFQCFQCVDLGSHSLRDKYAIENVFCGILKLNNYHFILNFHTVILLKLNFLNAHR